jgi:subtilisin family serine protease
LTSTPTPRAPERRRLLAAVALVLAALFLATGGQSAEQPAIVDAGAAAWRGFVDGDRTAVSVGQRAIVVLRYASLAERVRRAGGHATEVEMKTWAAAALAGQKQIAARLSREGVQIVPDFVYTRTLNGFAAVLDARALALLERDRDVVGVYPVRVAYPAADTATLLGSDEFGLAAGRRAVPRVPGFDGTGVTIALLDTGIDATHPYLLGRLLEGIDVLDAEGRALARPHPHDPALVERHATQTAGLLVGRGGPAGLEGVAPGATLLPIRVAGWQPSAEGGFTVYGRTDQLLAGLERAVDPDGDGSTLDGARVALVGVAEPFAAFADGPLARAVAGAARLDTLVVAPAGNDGLAGPGYGSIAAPGGAPAALTVGALDARRQTPVARVVVRAGLRVLLDEELPLAGAVAPDDAMTLELVRPGAEPRSGLRAEPLARFFDAAGYSLVAGRAALLERSTTPADAGRRAALAGAEAVVVDGIVPAGALGLDERIVVPVVGLPAAVAAEARRTIARGARVTVSLGSPALADNPDRRRVALFSSHGLAFGSAVKPEVIAPGVELVTADTGRNEDQSARYATLSGSSAAAAVAAGTAAVLAQARPSLGAQALKGVLVGTAAPLAGASPSGQGAGAIDAAGAVAAEVAASPATVAFGAADQAGWQSIRRLTVTNVSMRRLRLTVQADPEGIRGIAVTAFPRELRLRPGRQARLTLRARVAFLPRRLGAVTGSVRLLARGGDSIVIPWAVALPPSGTPLVSEVRLSAKRFPASDQTPAVLSLRAGSLRTTGGRPQLQPLARLDVELWRGARRIGLLARLRDVLPGNYAFGVTGRGPRGGRLARGDYRLRVVAVPPDGARQFATVGFTLGPRAS